MPRLVKDFTEYEACPGASSDQLPTAWISLQRGQRHVRTLAAETELSVKVTPNLCRNYAVFKLQNDPKVKVLSWCRAPSLVEGVRRSRLDHPVKSSYTKGHRDHSGYG